ncbi:MAG: tRNA (N(6)-L-threonylcarbamoyladenosine(37)-C(2))-methylthiotransferase MtaB [Desulfobacterales bacterium]
MPYKYLIITLGCRVNQCESDAIARSLDAAGWLPGAKAENADLCIVNTCTVTQRAAMQSRQTVRQMVRANPGACIAVTGCYAQTEPEALRKISKVSCIIGHSHKHEIPQRALSLIQKIPASPLMIVSDVSLEQHFRQFPFTGFGDRSRPVLKIQDGCNAFCSYCIVPYARGRSRSMPAADVLESIRKLADAGFREVVLSGIHVGCYGHDLVPKTGLYDLLCRIEEQAQMDRVRISSIEPRELTPEIIQLIAGSDRFCRHFHIPLQSGDDNILRKMGRPYTRDEFRDLIFFIRDTAPDAAIGADTLIGFPGETDAAFENTFSLVEELPLSYLHVFPFSIRKGTRAADFPNQIPSAFVKKRCAQMRRLGKEKKRLFYESFIGKPVQVLAENRRDIASGRLKGISSQYLSVLFDGAGELKNRIVRVCIREITKENLAVGICCDGSEIRKPENGI